MTENHPTPRDEAYAWWKERASAEGYVGGRRELPSAAAVRVLRAEGLLAETLGGWGWVILGPESPDAALALRRNYWPLVRILLDEYEPSEIFRISAVRIFAEDPSIPGTLHVRHAANRSKRRLEVSDGLEILVAPDDPGPEGGTGLGEKGTVAVSVEDVELPLSSPARTLLSLTLGDVREHLDLVLSWLRSLVVSRPALEAAYEASPRHVLLARMGHLARDVGNTRLADQIDGVLSAHHRHRKSRTDTGVGSDLVVPAYITARPSTRDPGLDRLQARLLRAAEVVDSLSAGTERRVALLLPDEAIRLARSAKLEDTYHSTTIEGYRITREEVSAVLEGVPYEGRTPDEIERLMALKGYSRAFDRTLVLVREASGEGGPELTRDRIFDLHLELWGPSIDAGIVSASDLRGWRRSPVFIRESRYVPPAPEKVDRYMAHLTEQINGLGVGPITRAVLAHWGFVHVHPFMDGNGRLARLLMNYVLAGSGFPWTTIRADERRTYFEALERAHVDDEFAPLGEFMRDAVVRSLEAHSR